MFQNEDIKQISLDAGVIEDKIKALRCPDGTKYTIFNSVRKVLCGQNTILI